MSENGNHKRRRIATLGPLSGDGRKNPLPPSLAFFFFRFPCFWGGGVCLSLPTILGVRGTEWEKNLQSLKSWAWLPKFCRTQRFCRTSKCHEAKIAATQCLPLSCRAITLTAGVILKRPKLPLLWGRGNLGGILRDNLGEPGEGNCESNFCCKTTGSRRGLNFCREALRCLAGPSGFFSS